MTEIMLLLSTILLYAIALAVTWYNSKDGFIKKPKHYKLALAIGAVALLLHSLLLLEWLHFWVNLGQVHSVLLLQWMAWLLFLVLYLFACFVATSKLLSVGLVSVIVALILQLYHATQVPTTQIANTPWVHIHIVVSVIASVLVLLLALCTFLLHLANANIKQARLNAANNIVALSIHALQKIQKTLLVAAWLLLGVTWLGGLLFSDSLLAQKLLHKIFFTLAGWIMLTGVLLQYYKRFWSTQISHYLIYTSAFFVLLGYFGTRIMLDIVL